MCEITAIPDIPKMLGVNRTVSGRAITNPVGDPKMTAEQEDNLTRKYVLKALELLQTEVEGPTVVSLD